MNKQEQQVLATEAHRVSLLRLEMLEEHPFWGHLLLAVRLVPAPELPAFAATDCLRHIWYNPLRTRHLDHAQLGFVLAHEVGHQLLESAQRRQGRNHQLWNCATDYAINRVVSCIPASGGRGRRLYRAPEGDFPGLGQVRILLDPRWGDRIAEAIYEEILAEQVPEPRILRLVLPLEQDDEGRAEDGGLTVSGTVDHQGGVDVHLPVVLSPEAREELARRVAEAIEAQARAGGRGERAGGLLREVALEDRPRLDWRQVLWHRASLALRGRPEQLSLARPSRRYLVEDLVVPGYHAEKIGRLVVALDTSGSMSSTLLSELGRELAAMACLAEDVTLLTCDAQVHQAVQDGDLEGFLREGKVKGGGGTDHRPVFAWLRDQGAQPDLLVAITDLYSRFPEAPPPFPVLWLVPSRHGDAPWGEVLELSDIE